MKKIMILLAIALTSLTAGAQTEKKGYDRANMNLSVKPGDDFREYAVGTYNKNHPLRADQRHNGPTVDQEENNEKQINDLINELTTTPQAKGSLGQKIATLYNQMMDSVGRDKLGYTPIKPWLERIRKANDLKEYFRVCTELDRKGGNTLMFSTSVLADFHQADSNLVYVGTNGLGLTRNLYFDTDAESEAIRKAYQEYTKKLFMLVGYDEQTAQKKMETVYALEKRIATLTYTPEKMRDFSALYHKMSYQQLLRDFPGIDWTTFFWVAGFPAFDNLNIIDPEPVHEIEKILADTPLEDMKTFAELKVIFENASVLSSDFRKAEMAYKKVADGIDADKPMWKRATDLVNDLMAWPLGKLYCERYFPELSKQRVSELVRNLKEAFAQRIDEATWMSAETKAQAKDKLEHFIVKIGYPDKWIDCSGIDVSDSLTLVENIANVNEFFCLDNLNRKVNKRTDKSEWAGVYPQTCNAYNNPLSNSLTFPAGILQPPFFDPEADDALNYGAIGAVIGHEMSHGFDDQGCNFDKDGNMRNWWVDEDKKNFDARGQLLVNQFSNIVAVNGKKINGNLTLGENIGDNGGLNIALRAMHNAGISNTIDGFTADQRFFLSWAYLWGDTMRPQLLEWLIANNPHSPSFARINGALPMIDEWYTAFGIKKGKLFVPKSKRAHIW